MDFDRMHERLRRREVRRVARREDRFDIIIARMGLTSADFDKHHLPIKHQYATKMINEYDVERMGQALKLARKQGVTGHNVGRRQLEKLRIINHDQRWSKKVEKKVQKIRERMFASQVSKGAGKIANPLRNGNLDRQVYPSVDDDVKPNDLPPKIEGNQIEKHNVVVVQPRSGPRPVNNIRQGSSPSVPKTSLLFPDGTRRLIPVKLTNPTETMRYNLPEDAIALLYATGEEMIRLRFLNRPDLAAACIQRFHLVDFHLKPSSQRPIQAMYEAVRRKKESLCLVDVEASLAFCLYMVSKGGYHGATYNHLSAFGVEMVASPQYRYLFDDDGQIVDVNGRRLPITLEEPRLTRTKT